MSSTVPAISEFEGRHMGGVGGEGSASRLSTVQVFSRPASFKSSLGLGTLFCCSFFCSLDQPCKTLQTFQVAPKFWALSSLRGGMFWKNQSDMYAV